MSPKSDDELVQKLLKQFLDKEFAHGYMEAFVNSCIAMQIRTLREQRGMKQSELAQLIGMKQGRISVMENADYGAWTISTLRRVAEAFDVVLKVSFESFGGAIKDVTFFSKKNLQRESRESSLKEAAFKHLHNGLELPTDEELQAMKKSALESFKFTEPARAPMGALDSIAVPATPNHSATALNAAAFPPWTMQSANDHYGARAAQ